MPSKLRIVVTAGPTREYLDTVRFLSNPSTGKMGYAIAAAAAAAGHAVTLITGPVCLAPPSGVRVIQVETSAEMARVTKAAFRRADAAIFAAAVCDYRPQRRVDRKLPKKTTGFAMELVPTEDIAAACGRIKGRRITIGFALEDHDAQAHAESKLRRKNFDAIVLNGPQTIGAEVAGVQVKCREGQWIRWAPARKSRVATRILRLVESLAVSRQAKKKTRAH